MGIMKTEELLDIIDEHLQEVNSDTEERTQRIKNILDFLNYNFRLTELSEKEKEDFVHCMEGYPLNDNMRETLNKCETEDKKSHYINMWARSTYFRQCAWFEYLYGNTNTKPI